ncbi:MAG: response regulator [Candidatus Saccharimonadales bacterium]
MAGLQKILLVEDNPQIVELYSTVLRKAGYDLELAGTVDTALDKAKQFQPDLILLDIMLPGGRTGLDALMILRTDPSYGCSDKHIIVLTNLGLTDKLEKTWQEYADSYVVKADIVPHDLLQIIESALK